MPENLDDQPSGELNFSFIKLPDYVTSTEPLTFEAFSDVSLLNGIFSETGEGRGAIL